MPDRKKIGISGINGRMGRAVSRDLLAGNDKFELVAALGKAGAPYIGSDVADLIGMKKSGVSISADIKDVLSKCDILLEFTIAETSVQHAGAAIAQGVRPVIGTSGIAEAQVQELSELAGKKRLGALVIPNFSVGAVLMMEFAKQAGAYFGNVEIVEMHHTRKLDAPSGTAMHTIKKLGELGNEFNKKEVDDHELVQGSRGGLGTAGVRVHSLRLPGLISHQEVIFGSPGELLTIRHDSFNTDCFLNGIHLALAAVSDLEGLVVGLDKVLGLGTEKSGAKEPARA